MPYKPKRPCAKQGCPNLIPIGQTYCEAHRKKDTRPNAARRGYGAKWQKIRAGNLRVYKTCAKCGAPAIDVHHIVPLKNGGTNEWSNLQPLCRKCHRIITAGTQDTAGVQDKDYYPIIIG